MSFEPDSPNYALKLTGADNIQSLEIAIQRMMSSNVESQLPALEESENFVRTLRTFRAASACVEIGSSDTKLREINDTINDEITELNGDLINGTPSDLETYFDEAMIIKAAEQEQIRKVAYLRFKADMDAIGSDDAKTNVSKYEQIIVKIAKNQENVRTMEDQLLSHDGPLRTKAADYKTIMTQLTNAEALEEQMQKLNNFQLGVSMEGWTVNGKNDIDDELFWSKAVGTEKSEEEWTFMEKMFLSWVDPTPQEGEEISDMLNVANFDDTGVNGFFGVGIALIILGIAVGFLAVTCGFRRCCFTKTPSFC